MSNNDSQNLPTGRPVENTESKTPDKENTMSKDEVMMAMMKSLIERIEKMETGTPVKERRRPVADEGGDDDGEESASIKPLKPRNGRFYELLEDELPTSGKFAGLNLPVQQSDIADILARNLEIGKRYSEKEVYDMLEDCHADYQSLKLVSEGGNGKQHVTRVFRYYKSFDKTKYASYFRREFLRQHGK